MKPESLSSNQKDGIRWIGGGKYSPSTHSTSSGQASSPGPFDKLRASSPGTGRTGWQIAGDSWQKSEVGGQRSGVRRQVG